MHNLEAPRGKNSHRYPQALKVAAIKKMSVRNVKRTCPQKIQERRFYNKSSGREVCLLFTAQCTTLWTTESLLNNKTKQTTNKKILDTRPTHLPFCINGSYTFVRAIIFRALTRGCSTTNSGITTHHNKRRQGRRRQRQKSAHSGLSNRLRA